MMVRNRVILKQPQIDLLAAGKPVVINLKGPDRKTAFQLEISASLLTSIRNPKQKSMEDGVDELMERLNKGGKRGTTRK